MCQKKRTMQKIIKFLLLMLFLWVIYDASIAQSISINPTNILPETSPTKVGISEKRLARIDAHLQKNVAEGNVPGVVALIARNGKVVYHKAYGPVSYTHLTLPTICSV